MLGRDWRVTVSVDWRVRILLVRCKMYSSGEDIGVYSSRGKEWNKANCPADVRLGRWCAHGLLQEMLHILQHFKRSRFLCLAFYLNLMKNKRNDKKTILKNGIRTVWMIFIRAYRVSINLVGAGVYSAA